MGVIEKVSGMPKTYYHYPRIVAIVGITAGKFDNFIPVVWHTGLSFSPPLYGVSISPKRHSYEMLYTSGEFTVNFVEFKYRKTIEYFGSVSGREVDKAKHAGVNNRRASIIDAPIPDMAYLSHECELVDSLGTGDHTLFIGKVLLTQYKKEYFDNAGMLKTKEKLPLLYIGKHFYITVNPNSKDEIKL